MPPQAVRAFDGQRVRNIFCAGRNYVAHAKELGNAPAVGEPFFFLKPTSSLVFPPHAIQVPAAAAAQGAVVLHHEVELAVIIKSDIRRELASEAEAWKHVLGYCCVIDVTARNWQDEAKSARLPWTKAKGGRTFLPCSPELIVPERLDDPITLELKVNGTTKQLGSTKDMIHSVPRLLMFLSRTHTLLDGDMVLTGTPSGVGLMLPGDEVEISAFGRPGVKFNVVAAAAAAL